MTLPKDPTFEYYNTLCAIARRERWTSSWRQGQLYFNVLNDVRPDLADQVRGTDLDPFYVDSRLNTFLEWVAHNWTQENTT